MEFDETHKTNSCLWFNSLLAPLHVNNHMKKEEEKTVIGMPTGIADWVDQHPCESHIYCVALKPLESLFEKEDR